MTAVKVDVVSVIVETNRCRQYDQGENEKKFSDKIKTEVKSEYTFGNH